MKSLFYFKTLMISVIATLAVVALCNLFIDPYGFFNSPVIEGVNKKKNFKNTRLTKPYQVESGNYEAVILGSSRGERGLDPEHRAFSGLAAYNLGMPGATQYELKRNLLHAFAANPLKTVVISLDLFSFSAYNSLPSGFDENRYLTDDSGKKKTARTYVRDMVNVLLSIDGFRASKETLKNNRNTEKPSSHYFNGQGTADEKARSVQRHGGHRGAFLDFEKNYLKKGGLWLNGPNSEFSLINKSTGLSTLAEYEELLRFCYANNIDTKIFVSPIHSRLMYAMSVIGMKNIFLEWKDQLVVINGKVALEKGEKPFAIWDFAIFNQFTNSDVPDHGDKVTQMDWFWESAHYKQEFGDAILDIIYQMPGFKQYLMDGMGIEATLGNRKISRAKFLSGIEEFSKRFPDDAKEICLLAEKLNTRKHCDSGPQKRSIDKVVD